MNRADIAGDNEKISLIAHLESNGVSTPHYCYHNNLSIVGNCRTCLLEIKSIPKPVMSCASETAEILGGNNIYLDSPFVKKARENSLEFLLLNHPLDCPICDQGGDCDLQDQSLLFGFSKRRFFKFKRVVTDKSSGLIIKTVMTRCIHCTRCVRFVTEIAGIGGLGMLNRGGSSEIGFYRDRILFSELSGNIVELCPVGIVTQLVL